MATATTPTCTPGEYLYVTGGGRRMQECSAPNQWTPVAVASVARTFFGLASMSASWMRQEHASPCAVTSGTFNQSGNLRRRSGPAVQ